MNKIVLLSLICSLCLSCDSYEYEYEEDYYYTESDIGDGIDYQSDDSYYSHEQNEWSEPPLDVSDDVSES